MTMEMNTGMKELNVNKMEQAVGGIARVDNRCGHSHAVKTGKKIECSFLFFSWTETQYYCPDCGKTYTLFW